MVVQAKQVFQLGSGVRQGDSLSPSLFLLFLEPFMNHYALRNDTLAYQSKVPQRLNTLQLLRTIVSISLKILVIRLILWPRSIIMHKVLGLNYIDHERKYLVSNHPLLN